jgi:hypothetical protein
VSGFSVCRRVSIVAIVALAVLLSGLLRGTGGHAEAQETRAVVSLAEIRTRNVVIQQWDISCGAAVLATLLKYQHGEDVTERDVALEMIGRAEYLANPGLVRAREGFSLLDMKRVAEGLGYDGIGLGQLDFEDLLEFAPIAVPMEFHGYRHFVIFVGALGDRVLLADPSYGNRTLRRADFLAAWMSFPELGHVGFRVVRRDNLFPPNRLLPTPAYFQTLN